MISLNTRFLVEADMVRLQSHPILRKRNISLGSPGVPTSIAPSGMAFYTGDKFPRWQGDLFVGALAGQMLVRLRFDGEELVEEDHLLKDELGRIRDVRVGPDGLIYLLTDHGNGVLARLEPVEDEK
ncbi:hypothetical protein GSUB_08340 [Geoalkalibacter subterraneus]|uniref:Glucose/Sorbosone dehydrogenase domain-containing protein n=1 Tax=Geoalkalibacter subterraneus TaxID=483547 RepID=A0A0B5FEN0_9BACT|nr:hypothetical protein GSUB_08340 [Geoalkalibacter subterraneus]